MVRIAKRDTIATETVFDGAGQGTEVQRKVFAGHQVPDHYDIEEDDVTETDAAMARSRPGYTLGGEPVEGTQRVDSEHIHAPENAEEAAEMATATPAPVFGQEGYPAPKAAPRTKRGRAPQFGKQTTAGESKSEATLRAEAEADEHTQASHRARTESEDAEPAESEKE